MHLSTSTRVTLVSRLIDSSRLRPITGNITFSSKLPWVPANATVASLPMTCAQTIMVASGSTGLTLPGMIDDARLQVGQLDLAQPGGRAGAHPAQVVADLEQADGDAAQLPGRLDQAVPGGLRLEVVAGLGEGQPGRRVQLVDDRGGEPGRGVDPGADRGAAERQLGEPGQRGVQPLLAVADLRGVPAELLAEGDRGGVHQVGAAGLHHGRPLFGLLPAARSPGGPAPGIRLRTTDSVAATWIEVGKTSLDDWDALTWSFGCTLPPSNSAASVAITSLAFMLELVPDPVWNTSSGKSP